MVEPTNPPCPYICTDGPEGHPPCRFPMELKPTEHCILCMAGQLIEEVKRWEL